MNRSGFIRRLLIGIVIVLAILLYVQISTHTLPSSGSSSGTPYYYHTTSSSHPEEDDPPSENSGSHPVTEP